MTQEATCWFSPYFQNTSLSHYLRINDSREQMPRETLSFPHRGDPVTHALPGRSACRQPQPQPLHSALSPPQISPSPVPSHRALSFITVSLTPKIIGVTDLEPVREGMCNFRAEHMGSLAVRNCSGFCKAS